MQNVVPKALIFDFDGVIVDSEPLHCRAFQVVCDDFGIGLSESEYYRELIGFDDRGAFQHLFKIRNRPLDETTFTNLLTRKAATVEEMMARGEFAALPHAVEFITDVAERFPLAICSGALRHEIETMLRAIGLHSYFKLIVAAEDVTVGKPDPSGYLLATKQLGEAIGQPLQPSEVLIIEDAPSVVRSVNKAGFKTLAVTTSHRRQDFGEADTIFADLNPRTISQRMPFLFAAENA